MAASQRMPPDFIRYSPQPARHRTRQAVPITVIAKKPAVSPTRIALTALVATIPTANSAADISAATSK